MSDSNLGSVDSQENEYVDQLNFELMDYLTFDQWIDEDPPSVFSHRENQVDVSGGAINLQDGSSNYTKAGDQGEISSSEVKERVAFKTKTDIEILDDGFKWRKYGKKMVKNNPNPRNYYRCSTEGCPVKKRVERDKDDHSYILTTYEGVHNHQSPLS